MRRRTLPTLPRWLGERVAAYQDCKVVRPSITGVSIGLVDLGREIFKKDRRFAVDRNDFWRGRPRRALDVDRDVGGALASALLAIGGLIVGAIIAQ